MLRTIGLLLVVCIALTSCAGANTWIQPSRDQLIPPPPRDKAQVIFLRPSTYFPGLVTLLYEIKSPEDQLISPIGGMNKVVYHTEPGDKVFMSNNGVMSHFLTARIEAGKRYYVLVRPIHGYGFQLRPIRSNGTTSYNTALPEFSAWVRDTAVVEPSETARRELQVEKYKAGFADVKRKGFAEWKAKSAEQHAELTLNPDDAVSL
jgi:hypothetical protein